jgi:hypothetical protein
MCKSVVQLLIFVALVGGVAAAQGERIYTTIVVTAERPAYSSTILVDYNADFAWVGQSFGDPADNTKPGVFVHSHAHEAWLQILRVSTAGAKFGKSPAGNTGIQEGWDFTSLASKKFVPLPLPDAGRWSGLHIPKKVVYDAPRDVFVMYFDVDERYKSMLTTLVISKKDLLQAFDDEYGRHP